MRGGVGDGCGGGGWRWGGHCLRMGVVGVGDCSLGGRCPAVEMCGLKLRGLKPEVGSLGKDRLRFTC